MKKQELEQQDKMVRSVIDSLKEEPFIVSFSVDDKKRIVTIELEGKYFLPLSYSKIVDTEYSVLIDEIKSSIKPEKKTVCVKCGKKEVPLPEKLGEYSCLNCGEKYYEKGVL